jgi:5-bromo-4-chloroindolyl phosphate hydrolysis protein
MAEPEKWHLHKGVPLALIAVIIVQSVSIIQWSSTMSSTVEQMLAQVAENKADIKKMAEDELRLVKVETDISYIRTAVDDNKETMKELQRQLTELIRETKAPRRPR